MNERGGIDSARAWRMAVATAITNGVAFGTIYTFGTFFQAMADDLDAGLGPTSIVFGITLFLFFGTGAASGFLADRWGPRPLIWVGGVLFCLGLVLTSRVQVVWHGYFTYGLGAGLGGGLFVSPLFATVAGWFERHRALGQGVAVTGNGLGTLILLPTANALIQDHGWRQAYIILAVVCAVAFTIGGWLMARPPIEPPPSAGRHLRSVLATTSFRRLVVGSAMALATQSSAFAFTVLFATNAGISSGRAALLVGLIGAASIGGRLLLTGLSRRVGPVRMLQGCFLVQPVAFTLLAVAGGNYSLLIAYAVVFGLAYGGFVALVGEVSAHLFGVRGLGAVLGWVYLISAVGSLLGPPLLGFLADATDTDLLLKLAMVAVAGVGSLYLLRLSSEPALSSNTERLAPRS